MRLIVCLAVAAAQIVGAAPSPKAQGWVGPSGIITLKTDSTRVLIKFPAQLSGEEVEDILASFSALGSRLADNRTLDGFSAFAVVAPDQHSQLIAELRAHPGIYLAEPYYLDSQDSALVIGESAIIAFDSALTRGEIEAIAASERFDIDRELTAMHNVFMIRNTQRSGHGLLELVNLLDALSATRWAEPNYRLRAEKFVYQVFDDYCTYQNHTKKVIGRLNEASVWDFAGLAQTSDSLIVAVVDDGVTHHWYDLSASRILPGYDFCTGDSIIARDNDPSPGPWMGHGMACVGIIAAAHATDSAYASEHQDGVIGLNPTSRIMPVKIFPDSDSGFSPSAGDFADAINFA